MECDAARGSAGRGRACRQVAGDAREERGREPLDRHQRDLQAHAIVRARLPGRDRPAVLVALARGAFSPGPRYVARCGAEVACQGSPGAATAEAHDRCPEEERGES